MADALEAVIRPIVEGQIKSFFNDYPKIAEAKLGKRFGKTVPLREFASGSIAKRIVLDLLCPQTRMRLEAAVMQGISGTVDSDPRATSTSARKFSVALAMRWMRAALTPRIGVARLSPPRPSQDETP